MAADHWEDRYEMIFSSDHLMELTAKGADKGGTRVRGGKSEQTKLPS